MSESEEAKEGEEPQAEEEAKVKGPPAKEAPAKKKSRGAWLRYEHDYKTGRITLKNRRCPRCSKVMARHQSPARWSCGGCGFSEYIRSNSGRTE